MKILKAKSKRSLIFTIITLAIIVTLFGVNLLLSIVGLNKTVYIDMTPEGLYSVSDEMLEECKFLNGLDKEKQIKIIFCNDPDKLKESTVTRTTYFMALKLQNKFDNISVEAENVNFNPTKVAKYKATSLSEISTNDVIVAYGDRYRIVSAESFWSTADGGTEYAFYNGEYKLATLLKSVTRANGNDPVAYFITGHGETVYNKDALDSAGTLASEQFKNLLVDRGLRVGVIDLSKVDKVPDDCAVLIINNPTEDYKIKDEDKDKLNSFSYVSELEKIDRFLTQNQGALMVSIDPGRENLDSLKLYLDEWGFDFSSSVLHVPKDPTVENPYDYSNRTNVMNGVYSTDTESYAYAIYKEFSTLSSAPKTVFAGSGYLSCSFGIENTMIEDGSFDVTRIYNSFITAPKNAVPYTGNEQGAARAEERDSYDLAAVSVRTCFNNTTAERTYSYVFCANDGDFFSNDLLGNAAYANFEIMSALVDNISRTDIYASTALGGSTLNTDKVGGKQLVSTVLLSEDTEDTSPSGDKIIVTRGITGTAKTLITVAVAVMPIAALTMGVIVHLKRKYR